MIRKRKKLSWTPYRLAVWSKLQNKHRLGKELWSEHKFVKDNTFKIGDKCWEWDLGEWWKYVYVLEDTTGAYKIGMSSKPIVRLDKMQTGNSGKLLHRIVFAISQHVVRDIEKALHDYFIHENVHGEWFKGPDIEKWVKSYTNA